MADHITVTGETMYAAMLRDPFFRDLDANVQNVWRIFANELAKLFTAEALNRPISISSFLEARLKALMLMRRGGWIQLMIEATPEREFRHQSREAAWQVMCHIVVTASNEVEEAIKDPDAYLKMRREDEPTFMFRLDGGDLDEAFHPWLKGELTLGGLLTTHPSSLYNLIVTRQIDTMPVNGTQIFDGLVADDAFLESNAPSTYDGWRDLCRMVPPVVGSELLSQRVTVQSFMATKLAILREIVRNEWILRIFGPNATLTHGLFVNMLALIIEQVAGVDVLLDAQGLTEEAFLELDSGGRFNKNTLERWREGDLTIAQLLILQPYTLLNNA